MVPPFLSHCDLRARLARMLTGCFRRRCGAPLIGRMPRERFGPWLCLVGDYLTVHADRPGHREPTSCGLVQPVSRQHNALVDAFRGWPEGLVGPVDSHVVDQMELKDQADRRLAGRPVPGGGVRSLGLLRTLGFISNHWYGSWGQVKPTWFSRMEAGISKMPAIVATEPYLGMPKYGACRSRSARAKVVTARSDSHRR
jgi:hypothetical protein